MKSISCEKEQTDSLAGHLCGDQLLECVKVFNIRMSSVIESAFGKFFFVAADEYVFRFEIFVLKIYLSRLAHRILATTWQLGQQEKGGTV